MTRPGEGELQHHDQALGPQGNGAGATPSPPSSSATAEGIIRRLVQQRQELRRAQADRVVLEANRLAIVYWQQRFSTALLDERLPRQ